MPLNFFYFLIWLGLFVEEQKDEEKKISSFVMAKSARCHFRDDFDLLQLGTNL